MNNDNCNESKAIAAFSENVMEDEEKAAERKFGIKAFQLATIMKFISCSTPMVLGYAYHNKISEEIQQYIEALKSEFKLTLQDTCDISQSKEWEQIKNILGL